MLQQLLFASTLLATTTLNPGSIRGGEVFVTKDESSVQLLVPYTHQINDLTESNKNSVGTSACGPTVITMALNYSGVKIDLNEVIDKLPESVYVKKIGFTKLNEASIYFGKQTTELKNSPKNIYETLKAGKPVILNIQNYDGITGHAVLVTGIKDYNGQTAKSLIVHDPYVGPYREFKYISSDVIQQPEGYSNTIGTLKPFYIK